MIVVLTPLSFRLIGEAYRGIYPALVRARRSRSRSCGSLLAILALAPATVLMGATLPTLTRFLSTGQAGHRQARSSSCTRRTRSGRSSGTAIAGFALIELLGLTGALLVGAACSGDRRRRRAAARPVGAQARRRRRQPPRRLRPRRRPLRPRPSPARRSRRLLVRRPTPPRDRRRLALPLAFVSGLTSLGYQVVWNRLIGAGTGSSTYVFTIILVLFLVGIAIGAVLLGFIRPRVRSVVGLIAVAQLLTAAFVHGRRRRARLADRLVHQRDVGAVRRSAAGLRVVDGDHRPAAHDRHGPRPSRRPRRCSATRRATEGSASGSLLAINTVGAIVATFVLPFFVIPLIGSPATLAPLAIVNVGRRRAAVRSARAVAATARSGPSARSLAAGIAVVIVASLVRGTAFRNPTIAPDRAARAAQVFEATEDEIAPVVAGQRSYPQLWVNGTSMTLITVDTKLMPLLPLMLRPDADRGPRDRVRDGHRVPDARCSAGVTDRRRRARAVGARACSSGSTTTPTRSSPTRRAR